MNKTASELGKLARGIPKNFSPAERQRRRLHMKKLNAARKAGRRKKK
jgi:hypothetical protein